MARPTRPFKFSQSPLFPIEVWVIFAIAFIFRLAFFFHHQEQGFKLQHDPSLYLALAEGLKHGVFSMFHPMDIPETTRMPGYPAMLYVLHSVEVVLLVQVLLSSVKILLAYRLGLALGLKKDRMVLLPILLLAMEPMDILLTSSLITESLFTTFLLAGVLFLIRMQGWREVVLAAVFFASAAYLRPNGLHLAMLATVLVAFRSREDWRKAVALGGLLLVLLLPWALRNRSLDGRFHLSDSGAVVAAHFHVPEVLAVAGDPNAATFRRELTDMAAATDWTDRSAMRSYFTEINDQVRNSFFEYPLAWAYVQLRKAVRILFAPGSGHINLHFEAIPIAGYAVLLFSALYSVLLLVICVGLMAQAGRMKWEHWMLVILVLAILFTSAISTADSRFKNPVMPYLLLLGAWAWEGWKWGHSGKRRSELTAGGKA